MSPAQMVTVIIALPGKDGAALELDSLVRRMGFDIIAQMTSIGDGSMGYQVTGTRDWPLHDDGIEAVRRELGDLVYQYSIPALSVGFGSIDTHLDL